MKNGGKTLIYAAGCIVLALAARAAVKSPDEAVMDKSLSKDNPYSAIVERNVFDLHDPPAHDAKDDKPKEPPANIKLTGITTIFGPKKALFIVNKPGAAGKQPTIRSLMLAEGQRSDELEVLEINPKARTAKIKNDGIESLIHIETNKTFSSGPAPAGPAGGVAGAHVPGVFSGATPGGGNIPQRPMRGPNGPGAQNNNNGNGAMPQRQFGGGATTPQVAPSMTPEETYTLMEATKATTQDPILSQIIPPTPLSPQQNQPQQNSPGGATTGPTGPQSPIGSFGTGTFAK